LPEPVEGFLDRSPDPAGLGFKWSSGGRRGHRAIRENVRKPENIAVPKREK